MAPVAKALAVETHFIDGIEIEVKALKSRKTAATKLKNGSGPTEPVPKVYKKTEGEATQSESPSTKGSVFSKTRPGSTSLDQTPKLLSQLEVQTNSDTTLYQKAPSQSPDTQIQRYQTVPAQQDYFVDDQGCYYYGE